LVKPSSIELWKEGDFRTHQRAKILKKDDETWESSFLSP
jgi:pyridoxine/pyridoxamine 5'-phosphate oxidase